MVVVGEIEEGEIAEAAIIMALMTMDMATVPVEDVDLLLNVHVWQL